MLVNICDFIMGEIVLYVVMMWCDLIWMFFLIERGVNVNVCDNCGVILLVFVCNFGFEDGVELLVGK